MKKTGHKTRTNERSRHQETEPQGSPHVLVVEDEEAHAVLIRRGFDERKGAFRVSFAKTLADARRIIKEDPPALAFVDWLLPDGDGAGLLSTKVSGHPMPIIIMTSHGSEGLAVEMMKAGALDYLVKSEVMFAEIAHTTERALRECDHIRARQEMEEAVRQSESRFRELFNSMHSGVATYEAVDDGADFVFLDFNRAAETIDKIKKEDVIGRRVSEVFPGVREFGLLEVFSRVWRTGQPEHHPTSLYKDERIVGWRENYIYRLPSGEVVAVYDDVTKQKLADEALAEDAIRRRILIEQSSDGIVVLEGDGKVYEANQRYADMLGYSPEEVRQLHVWDWDAQFTRGQLLEMIRLIGPEGDHFETRHRRKDGTFIDVEISTNGAVHAGRKLVFCVCRDISKRKRAEEALRESEERYRTLVDHIPDLILVHREGILLYINPAAAEVMGYTQAEMTGTSITNYIIPEYHETVASAMRQRMVGASVEPYEIEVLTRSGQRRTVVTRGSRIDFAGVPASLNVLTDITEQKRTENELRQSEEQYRHVVNQVHDGIYVYRGTKFLFVNKRVSEITGYTREELLSGEFLDVVHPDDRNYVKEISLQRSRGEDAPPTYACRIITKDGNIRYIEIAVSPIIYQGSPAFLGAARDITENKQAEDELQQFARELESRVLQRTAELEQEIVQRKAAEATVRTNLAEKEVLLREIHHRVKNNLQIITSLIRLQKRQITDAGTLHVLVDSESRIRSMALVHEKLYRSADLASVDFSDYIQSLAKNLITTYAIDPRRIDLKIDVKDVILDINRAIPVGLIMNELIANALKHAFPGGKSGKITITGRNTPAGITLSVQDNGVGLPDGLDWRNTSSLGLHLVITLTQQVQGSIELNRTGGTAFDITIPHPKGERS